MTMIGEVEYTITAAAPGPLGAGASGLGVPVIPPPLVSQPVNLVRSSRNPTDGPDVRWQSGFSYLPMGNGELDLFSDCGPQGAQVPNTKNVAAPMWQAYVLSARFRCSLMGHDVADYQARAKGLLDAATPKMVEYEFWHGALAKAAGWNNLYLDSAIGDAYTAASVNEAIGICEWYLGIIGYGGRGMIHLSAFLAPYLQLYTRREGNLLLTNRDTIVVPGSGYGQYPATTPPTGQLATGATAGTPGTWTPAGSTPPASVAALQAASPPIVANPATLWTTGQYVQTVTGGPGGQASWNGTAWVSGHALLANEAYAAPPKPTGSVKLFATGITDVRLGEIVPVPDEDSFYQGIDRTTNSVMVGAQRYACASWDGVAFAEVDLTFTP